MNIAFDAKRLFNNFTGLGNHSRTTIDILTRWFPQNNYFLYTPKIKHCDATTRYLNLDGCIVRTPGKGQIGALWRTFGEIDMMKKDRIDIFHGLSHEIPVGLHKAGIKSVVTIHDTAFKTFTDMYHWNDILIYDLKFKYSCKNSDRIIAISENTKRDIMNFYNVPEEKIDVVYQPVNDIYYTPISKESARKALSADIPDEYLLYVGSVNSRKNLLSIIKAIELLPQDLQIPLIIIGNGREYKQKVLEYISKHHIEKNIIWAGFTDITMLQAYYTCAKAFIYPSFYEGFGLPVVEAMLCGAPVISSTVSSLPEAAGPSSLLVDPNDVEELSHAISKVLTDDDLCNHMISSGMEYANNMFNPQKLANKLIETYDKL